MSAVKVLSTLELRALCVLLGCDDPSSLRRDDREAIEALANREAVAHGRRLDRCLAPAVVKPYR